MLRVSAATSNTDVDISLVSGELSDNDDVAYANELTGFATAIASRDEAMLVKNREKLLLASNPEVVVDAAAVAANFQRMVRIADSIGIAVDEDRIEMYSSVIDTLDLRQFKSAENTPL